MHNIGLLLVRMGKFRDAVTNFQHIMHEQGDFQTGSYFSLYCIVCLFGFFFSGFTDATLYYLLFNAFIGFLMN